MNGKVLALAFASTCLAGPALAHVTLEVQEAKVGSTYKAVMRVPHGCGSDATHTVRVQIPEGFFNVKPMPKPGWELSTEIGPYEGAYDNHGNQLTEGVREITWAGGDLPNDWYDEFIFRGSFSGDLPVDQPFYFPAIQECANGEEAWIDISGDDEAEMPAPSVILRAK